MADSPQTSDLTLDDLHASSTLHGAIVAQATHVTFNRSTEASAFRAAADWIDAHPDAVIDHVTWDVDATAGGGERYNLSLSIDI